MARVVDGEMYGCVKSFCYLGDTIDGDSGADLTANNFMYHVHSNLG